ncbi:MAG: hypothetical protein ACFFC7_02675 [Candidatus Hermodarchaeota archaeon]
MNKWIYLGLPVLFTILVSTRYIITAAQLSQPEPVTTQWYVKEGDAFSWHVAKLRENGNVTSIPLFYNFSSGESLNVTEGDIITITVLTLGNASEYEGTCLIQTGEEQLSTRLDNTWIYPVYDRDYWVEVVAWSENQAIIHDELNLDGNLLTINTTFSGLRGYSKTVLDISTGLVYSFQSYQSYPSLVEIEINIMTGFWFLNITFPTLLLIGVIGAEIIIVIFLVRLLRRRKLELGK